MSRPDLAERCTAALRKMHDEKMQEIRAQLGPVAAETFDQERDKLRADETLYWEAVERLLVEELRYAQKLVDAVAHQE